MTFNLSELLYQITFNQADLSMGWNIYRMTFNLAEVFNLAEDNFIQVSKK